MNFYAFHVGDYMVKTRHLTYLHDLSYRRLIDLYYTHETPLPTPVDRVSAMIGMPDCEGQVGDVLTEFFTLTENGWCHRRCDRVIEAYRARRERAVEHGKAGGRPANNPTLSRTTRVSKAPITITNTIKRQIPKKPTDAVFQVNVPEWIDAELWDQWRVARKAMKAPMSTHGERLLIAKLAKLREEKQDVRAVIEQSIANGYKGLFAIAVRDPTPAGVNPSLHRMRDGAGVDWWKSDSLTMAKGRELGMQPRPGESTVEYRDRLFVAIKARQAA